VSVWDPPVVTVNPKTKTLLAGANILITAKVGKGGGTGLKPQVPIYQWFKNTDPIPGATTSSYSLTALQPADAGTYICFVNNTSPTVGSNQCVLTVTPDGTAPKVVSLMKPKDKSVLTNGEVVMIDIINPPTNIAPLITVSGSATDDGLITSVVLSNSLTGFTSNATFQAYPKDPAAPVFKKTVKFLGQMLLADGTNVFTAFATDYGTNTSPSKNVLNVYYAANPTLLTVTNEGQGTNAGAWYAFGKKAGIVGNQAVLDVGQGYTITAKPKAVKGNGFVGWTDGTSTLGTTPILNFTMTPGLTLHAQYLK
jgi:hypothetical protein